MTAESDLLRRAAQQARDTHDPLRHRIATWLDHSAGSVDHQHQCRAEDVATGADDTTDEQWQTGLRRVYRHEIAIARELLAEETTQ